MTVRPPPPVARACCSLANIFWYRPPNVWEGVTQLPDKHFASTKDGMPWRCRWPQHCFSLFCFCFPSKHTHEALMHARTCSPRIKESNIDLCEKHKLPYRRVERSNNRYFRRRSTCIYKTALRIKQLVVGAKMYFETFCPSVSRRGGILQRVRVSPRRTQIIGEVTRALRVRGQNTVGLCHASPTTVSTARLRSVDACAGHE